MMQLLKLSELWKLLFDKQEDSVASVMSDVKTVFETEDLVPFPSSYEVEVILLVVLVWLWGTKTAVGIDFFSYVWKFWGSEHKWSYSVNIFLCTGSVN